MFARTSTVRHPGSVARLQTPLLVPSFSSKGFFDVRGKPYVKSIFRASAEFLHGPCLISAFDIGRKYLPSPRKFLAKPTLTIVDSGGYEISDDHDLATVIRSRIVDKEWSVNDLIAVLDAWPKELPAVFVSFDDPKRPRPLKDQIAAARELFRGRQDHLHTFLLKPERLRDTLEASLLKAVADPEQLQSFDIIGVTEKDLGWSVLDRMVQIARLRERMDDAGLDIPIHVFGALDPFAACLYFLAGAEIFDGLTWLRYAYDQASDRCVYLNNHGALHHGIHLSDAEIRMLTFSANYFYLLRLQEKMRVCESKNDISVLPNHRTLSEALDTLNTRLRSKKKGRS